MTGSHSNEQKFSLDFPKRTPRENFEKLKFNDKILVTWIRAVSVTCIPLSFTLDTILTNQRHVQQILAVST